MALIFSWAVVILILIAAGIILVHPDWRVNLAMLAAEYFAASWLVTRHLPYAMGTVKLVTGWMVVAALGITLLGMARPEADRPGTAWSRGAWYPIILMGIAALVTAGATPRIEAVIPGLGYPVIAGSLLLVASGMILLSLTADVFRVILGLLALLAGFEVLYAAVESSILVAGLLAVTNLAMGLVGCYLILAGSAELRETESS